jgi:hypothetical protein
VIVFVSASLLVKQPRVAGALNRRLAASFGRAVEVAEFDVSLWGGPHLVAEAVTVAEDPRFGHEYFLRAEQLTAGVRWTALIRGRLEFDSVVLTRPSLNLVRTADGQWNLESWLPWPSAPATPPEPGPPAPVAAPRLGGVRIEGGRINFKRGVDKHAFAVVAVEGAVSQAGNGQWNIDVEGRPMRAGVVVQEPGTIRVRGTLGGTSARFRPANLAVSWEDASLSDALRLLTSSDHGVRGEVAMEGRIAAPAPESLSENPAGALWGFESVLRISGVHRWDLPPRDSDPAFNLGVEGKLWPSLARAEFARIMLESAATQIRGSGFAQWGRAPAGYAGSEPAVSPQPDANFRFVSSGISLHDLFRWYPAFRREVGAGLVVEGYAGIDAEVRGWPLRVERAVMATGGARLRGLSSGDEASVSSAVLRYERRRGRVGLAPVAVRFGPAGEPPSATLRVEGAATPGAPWRLGASVATQGASASALLDAAASLGIAPLREWAQAGWQAQGLADLRLRWQGTLLPFAMRPQGSIRLRNGALRSSALPGALQIANAAFELASDERRIALQSARLFGAAWSGTLRQRAGQPWEATLSADALDVLAVHGALAPQLQPTGFLQRIAPGRSAAPRLAAVLPEWRARGRISIGQLRFHSLLLGQFKSVFALDFSARWSVKLSDASASFFGGGIRGAFEARAPEGSETPGAAYRAELRLRGVSLAALTAGTPRLRGYFTGIADADLTLSATGANRLMLLDSLSGEGTLEVRNGQINALNLITVQKGTTAFARATGRFRVTDRRLTFEELQLFARAARPSAPDWLVEGAAEPSGSAITLDMQLFPISAEGVRPSGRIFPEGGQRGYAVQGTLDAPETTAVVRFRGRP